MKILGVIPSRFNSSRLPGKPLKMIGDTSLVMRVFNQCSAIAQLSELVVATDDERIFKHVVECGGKAMMTSAAHTTGTERCAEVLENFGGAFDYVINIQGDEPFIVPDQIMELATILDGSTEIATLYKLIQDEEELNNPNIPKVALGENGAAMYFSRSVIPYDRNSDKSMWLEGMNHFKHVGIYGYRTDVLATICKLKPSNTEQIEQLEQLRWLSNGYRIRAVETKFHTISVDTQEDLEKARRHIEIK